MSNNIKKSKIKQASTSVVLGQQHSLRRRGNNTVVRTKRSNRRKRNKGNPSFVHTLPDINNKPIQTRCVRYLGDISGGTEVTFDSVDLRAFAGAVTSASTTYYPLAQSVLLKRVGLTIMSDSATGAGAVEFQWKGLNSPDVLHTLIVGPGFPNHRSFRPEEGSSAWLWWDATSTLTDLFSINSNDAEIKIFLDLEFEYILADGAITNVALTTTASVTGIIYRILPIGDPQFIPVGLSTDS